MLFIKQKLYDSVIEPLEIEDLKLTGEFDSGSERTLAARLIHASRARKYFGMSTAADG